LQTSERTQAQARQARRPGARFPQARLGPSLSPRSPRLVRPWADLGDSCSTSCCCSRPRLCSAGASASQRGQSWTAGPAGRPWRGSAHDRETASVLVMLARNRALHSCSRPQGRPLDKSTTGEDGEDLALGLVCTSDALRRTAAAAGAMQGKTISSWAWAASV